MKGQAPRKGRTSAGWPHYSAPTADGVHVNVPPMFGGPAPTQSVTGVPGPALGVGDRPPIPQQQKP